MKYQSKNGTISNIDPRLDDSIKWPNPMPLIFRLKGIAVLIVLLIAALIGIVPIHLLAMVFVWPFSETLWRRWVSWTTDTWFQFFLFYHENFNNTKLIFTGSDLHQNEWGMAICNHPSEADWFYIWSIMYRRNYMGNYRAILKDLLSYSFGVGWAMYNMEFLFLTRNWKKDKTQMLYTLEKYKQFDPFFILLFPEGTDYTPVKHERTVKYAKENNLPYYENLLVPRVKGWITTLKALRPRLEAVYDFTVAYQDGVKPTLWSAWCGWNPTRVHYHIRRYNLKDIPTEKADQIQWIYKRYEEKDVLLEYFKEKGHFPSLGDEGKIVNGKKVSKEVIVGSTITKEPFQMTPLGLSPFLWTIFWIAFMAFTCYHFTTPFVYWFYIVGWIFFTLTSFSYKLRQWRGIAPPDNYLDVKTKKS